MKTGIEEYDDWYSGHNLVCTDFQIVIATLSPFNLSLFKLADELVV